MIKSIIFEKDFKKLALPSNYKRIPVTSELQFPNDHYREYAGSGTYQSGVMFYKMYQTISTPVETPIETGESLIGDISDEVLTNMIAKSEKEIEEKKLIKSQKSKITTDTVDNYI